MSNQPPKLPLRLLRCFCDPRLLTYIEGDLFELFEEREANSGLRKAKWLFFWDVIKLIRPEIMRSFGGTYQLNHYGMFKNYLKIAIRNLSRHKAFAALNIAGLSVGLACSILIIIYVHNEFSYDTYHKKYDRTYRVLNAYGNHDHPESFDFQVWGCAPVGPALKEAFPEIEQIFRFTSPMPWLVQYEEKSFQEQDIVFADSTAFEVFDWVMLEGDATTALTRPKTVVLTKALATKYFGDESAIGKVLLMDNEEHYEVTGVMEDIPGNSHFSFDAMISMSTFQQRREWIFSSWDYVDFYTYFVVHPQAKIEHIENQKTEFLAQYAGKAKDYYNFQIEPLSEAYLYSSAARPPGPVGNLTNTYIFITVAIFVILIACINFMNLTTARSVERAKEVAIRKTIGSARGPLIFQFLMESIMMVLISFVIGSILVFFSIPYMESISGKVLSIEWLLTWENYALGCLLILAIGALSGSYPALVLSGFKPSKVLKGSYRTSASGTMLRKSLVIFQFALSIMLLVGTVIVYHQLDYVRNHQLGYNDDRMLVIDYGWDQQIQRHLPYIKQQFALLEDVVSISATRAVPGTFFPNAGTEIETSDGELINRSPFLYEIDEDFIPTYEIDVVAGRNYSREYATDSLAALMVNEAAAKHFGYHDPADIIGKKFSQWGREGKVIGVVKNFNYVSLHNEVEPLALRYATPSNTSMLSLKLKSEDLLRSLKRIEQKWNELAPHRPFVTTFLDQQFQTQYLADQRFGVIFGIFSGLAIFIACLGLLGLTIYSTIQRSKEIGIRKVLGASIMQIVTLLSTDFVKLYIVAFVVAVPVSWHVMNRWLEDFAYRIEIGWQVFLLAGVITFLLAIISVWTQAFKAATANPVDSLKDE